MISFMHKDERLLELEMHCRQSHHGSPMSNETALLNLQLPIPAEAVLTVSPHLDDHAFFRDVLGSWRCLGTKSRREAWLLLQDHPVAVVVSESELIDGDWKDLMTDLRTVPNPPRLIVGKATAHRLC